MMDAAAPKKRIVILGGGFAGVATARHLEWHVRRRPDVEIVHVSRDNFVPVTPLHFEVFSGSLDLRGCSLPIGAFLRSTRFVEANAEGILAAGAVPDPVVAALPVNRDMRGRIVVEATMRCPARTKMGAGRLRRDPSPGRLAVPRAGATRSACGPGAAGNIAAALDGRPPRPVVYRTVGMMGSLRHGKGFGQLLGVQVRGFPAWFVHHAYYLMQMPGWGVA
jgi:NADH dehydrogenase FAD-containing subunit